MLELLVDALAVYRATRVLTTDRIGQPWRDWLAEKGPTWEYLAQCDWCTSIWVGAGAAAASVLVPRAWRPVARALATSAVAGLIATHA